MVAAGQAFGVMGQLDTWRSYGHGGEIRAE